VEPKICYYLEKGGAKDCYYLEIGGAKTFGKYEPKIVTSLRNVKTFFQMLK
jgi:hypothetical protein